jgi:tRNA A-37 threonylcarbamoyl transferase component Bud32
MINKIMDWFSEADGVTPEVVTGQREKKRPSRGKALTVEETLLLASGMDLNTIRTRKSNPVFVKMPPSTAQRSGNISKQQSQQPKEALQDLEQQQSKPQDSREVSSSEKQEPKGIPVELTEKALKKLHDTSHTQLPELPQQSVVQTDLFSETNEMSLVRESICSKAVSSSIITSDVGRRSRMSSSECKNSHLIRSEELSSLPSENPCEYQKMCTPLSEHWKSIENKLTIAETKKRFFMTVPKPIIEPKIRWVTTVVSGFHLTLPDYYQPGNLIGRGAYASVFEATDIRTGNIVAIKRNRGFMNSVGDAKRILRELKLWMWFNHQDVCKLLDVIPILHENIFSFEDVYIVLERMDADLQQALEFCAFTKDHAQAIVYQILRSLKYIHSANVIHRDLKPANVLILTAESNTKITDFGCSRPLGLEDPNPDVLTEYVMTR